MSKVIILNGPPDCGKDYGADVICKSIPQTAHMRFKTVLYQHTADHYGLVLDDLISMCSNRYSKDVPSTALGGLSPRQALIHVSEKVFKPVHGKDYFGKASVQEIKKQEQKGFRRFIFSDGGFPEEVEAVTDYVGPKRVMVIRILADGCSFKEDSRNWLRYKDFDRAVSFITIHNNKDKKFEQDILWASTNFFMYAL